MAHAQLSAVYANTGQSALAPTFSREAFELRDRVSERERFFISWRYYRDAIQAWDKALELARSWTATYPREAFAFNSLGSALIRLGQFEQSVEPFRQAIRLDPEFIPAYSNLAASLLALNRLAEARAVLQQAADQGLDFIGARRLSYLLAFVEGDTKTMDARAGGVGRRARDECRLRLAGAHVRVRRPRERRRTSSSAAASRWRARDNFAEVAAQLSMEDAETHAIVGQCAEARAEVSAGARR